MNHISSIRLAALAIGALSCAQSSAMGAPKADKDRAAIVALEQKFNDAFAAKNVDAIMACYAPGNQLFIFDVVPPRAYPSAEAYRKDWEALFAAFPGPLTIEISDQTITVVGPVAYGHNIQTATFTGKDGKKFHLVVRATDIYRKLHGAWLIVEEHNSVPIDFTTMKPDLQSKM
jgi:uncharacterized protein (TIGR02246 family)